MVLLLAACSVKEPGAETGDGVDGEGTAGTSTDDSGTGDTGTEDSGSGESDGSSDTGGESEDSGETGTPANGPTLVDCPDFGLELGPFPHEVGCPDPGLALAGDCLPGSACVALSEAWSACDLDVVPFAGAVPRHDGSATMRGDFARLLVVDAQGGVLPVIGDFTSGEWRPAGFTVGAASVFGAFDPEGVPRYCIELNPGNSCEWGRGEPGGPVFWLLATAFPGGGDSFVCSFDAIVRVDEQGVEELIGADAGYEIHDFELAGGRLIAESGDAVRGNAALHAFDLASGDELWTIADFDPGFLDPGWAASTDPGVDVVFAARTGGLVTHFVDGAPLSSQDIAEPHLFLRVNPSGTRSALLSTTSLGLPRAQAHLRLYTEGELTATVDVSEELGEVEVIAVEVSDLGEVLIAAIAGPDQILTISLRDDAGAPMWTRELGPLADPWVSPRAAFVTGGDSFVLAGPERVYGLSIER